MVSTSNHHTHMHSYTAPQHVSTLGQHVPDVSLVSQGGGAHRIRAYDSRTGPRAARGESGSDWQQLSMPHTS